MDKLRTQKKAIIAKKENNAQNRPIILDASTPGKEGKGVFTSKPAYVERPFVVKLTSKDPDHYSDVKGVVTYSVNVTYKGNDPNAFIILEGNKYVIGKNKTFSKKISFTLKKMRPRAWFTI